MQASTIQRSLLLMGVSILLTKIILIDMINEDFCSYEVAKLLKEKGFDEDCYTFYECDDKELYREERIPCCNSRSDDYAAPTHQMAMKWLREIELSISIIQYSSYLVVLLVECA